MIHLPAAGTYAPYFDTYISKVKGQDPIQLLKSQILDFKALLSEVPDEHEEFRYAPGKWSVKEVVGHIIDCERVFAYRAMSIARGEQANLPGFEEDDYVRVANFDRRSLYDLAHDFGFVRESTISLFKSFSEEDLDRIGKANGNPVCPRAIIYMIAGHHIHHEQVLRERYLKDLI